MKMVSILDRPIYFPQTAQFHGAADHQVGLGSNNVVNRDRNQCWRCIRFCSCHFFPYLSIALASSDLLNVRQIPCLLEQRFLWGVETEQDFKVLRRARIDPVGFFTIWSRRSEIEVH